MLCAHVGAARHVYRHYGSYTCVSHPDGVLEGHQNIIYYRYDKNVITAYLHSKVINCRPHLDQHTIAHLTGNNVNHSLGQVKENAYDT